MLSELESPNAAEKLSDLQHQIEIASVHQQSLGRTETTPGDSSLFEKHEGQHQCSREIFAALERRYHHSRPAKHHRNELGTQAIMRTIFGPNSQEVICAIRSP